MKKLDAANNFTIFLAISLFFQGKSKWSKIDRRRTLLAVTRAMRLPSCMALNMSLKGHSKREYEISDMTQSEFELAVLLTPKVNPTYGERRRDHCCWSLQLIVLRTLSLEGRRFHLVEKGYEVFVLR